MNLTETLFSNSPYQGFAFEQYPYDNQGWHSEDEIFKKLIRELRPRFIVEVGSWKGASAITMGNIVRELALDSHILCVDTWLGALEFWEDKNDPERYLSLKLDHGYPRVYYQFLANVMHQNLHDIITPFPQTSSIAARWLKKQGIMANLIYIDGSHDEQDVFQDLSQYWEILEKGGIFFGDDYDTHWPSVINAVNRFAKEKSLSVQTQGVFWMLSK